MGQVSNETLCSMPSFSRMYSLSWRLWGSTLPRPSMSERVMSARHGIQAGQARIGAARGRTTRHTRQPTEGEPYLASCDASAAPRRPGGALVSIV